MKKMEESPQQLDGAQVYLWIILSEENNRTDAVHHYAEGREQTQFSALAIAGYLNEGKREKEVYLFYCDDLWKVMNDTLHDSVDEAKSFAQSQYSGPELKWTERRSNKAVDEMSGSSASSHSSR